MWVDVTGISDSWIGDTRWKIFRLRFCPYFYKGQRVPDSRVLQDLKWYSTLTRYFTIFEVYVPLRHTIFVPECAVKCDPGDPAWCSVSQEVVHHHRRLSFSVTPHKSVSRGIQCGRTRDFAVYSEVVLFDRVVSIWSRRLQTWRFLVLSKSWSRDLRRRCLRLWVPVGWPEVTICPVVRLRTFLLVCALFIGDIIG